MNLPHSDYIFFTADTQAEGGTVNGHIWWIDVYGGRDGTLRWYFDDKTQYQRARKYAEAKALDFAVYYDDFDYISDAAEFIRKYEEDRDER